MTAFQGIGKPDHTIRGRLLARLVDVSSLPTGSGSRGAWRSRRAVERLLRYWPLPLLERLVAKGVWRIVVRPGPKPAAGSPLLMPVGAEITPADLEPASGGAGHVLGELLVRHLADLERAIAAGAHPPASVVVTDLRRRLRSAYDLGYSTETAALTPDQYLVAICSRYMYDRRALSVVDPAGYALIHSTLFAGAFWRSIIGMAETER